MYKSKRSCTGGSSEPTEPVTLDWLKEVAFGWLGLMPEVFYDMELEDFFLMQKGFFAKRKQDQLQFANVAFCVDAIGWGLAGKKANYKKFISDWFGEKPKVVSKEDLKQRSQEIKRRIEFLQKVDEEKEKIKPKKKSARSVKNSH